MTLFEFSGRGFRLNSEGKTPLNYASERSRGNPTASNTTAPDLSRQNPPDRPRRPNLPLPTDIKPNAKPLPSALGQYPARPTEARRKRLASHLEKCHLRRCHSHDPKNLRLVVDVQRQAKHAQSASCSETSRSTHHCSSRSILPAILHPL